MLRRNGCANWRRNSHVFARQSQIERTPTTAFGSPSYLPLTDINAGRLSNVTLEPQVNGGAWTMVRQVQYTCYDGTQQYGGNLGDLRACLRSRFSQ